MVIDVTSFPKGFIILTGWRGSGKTITCQHWLEQAHQAGWTVSGLISPAVFENGSKTAIDVVNLKTGERRRLANLVNRNTGFDVTDWWDFSPQVMEWCNTVLNDHSPCDLFMVDELGPLEFLRQQGWVNAFQALKERFFQHAVVVIRPELLEEALHLWPEAIIIDLDT